MDNLFVWTMRTDKNKNLYYELALSHNLVFVVRQELPSGYWYAMFKNTLKNNKWQHIKWSYETLEQAQVDIEKIITNTLEQELGE